MALKPLGDRIVVRFEETEEKTASGFVLAGASHEATKTAEVLAVGEGIRTLTGELIAPSVAAGDKVLAIGERQMCFYEQNIILYPSAYQRFCQQGFPVHRQALQETDDVRFPARTWRRPC